MQGHGVKMTPTPHPPPHPFLFQLLEQRAFVDQQTAVGLHSCGCIMKWTGGPRDLYKIHIGPGVGRTDDYRTAEVGVGYVCESAGIWKPEGQRQSLLKF